MTADSPVLHPKRNRPKGPTAWKERARLALRERTHAKHGQRETVLREMIDGTHVNTVRREIKALLFLDDLENSHPELCGRLEAVPFNSIEILARWHEFDPTGSVAAAKKRASGEYSSSSLLSAMKLARAAFHGLSRKDLPDQIRSSISRAVTKLFSGALLVRGLALPEPNRPPIDVLFNVAHADGRSERVAGVIVGPHRNADTYSKRRQEELLRALGMAWMFDHVVVILPAAGDLADYQHSLTEYVDVSAGRGGREVAAGHAYGPRVHIIRIDKL